MGHFVEPFGIYTHLQLVYFVNKSGNGAFIFENKLFFQKVNEGLRGVKSHKTVMLYITQIFYYSLSVERGI